MSAASTQSKSTVVSDRVVARFTQGATLVAAIALFPMCIFAAIKFASSPFEIFAGVVMGGTLSVAMVVMGLVIPIAISSRQIGP